MGCGAGVGVRYCSLPSIALHHKRFGLDFFSLATGAEPIHASKCLANDSFR